MQTPYLLLMPVTNMKKPAYNEVAVFQYRCRRCRELFDSNVECAAQIAENVLIRSMFPIEGYDSVGATAPKLMMHSDTEQCVVHGIAGIGLGDLAGYRLRQAL